MPKAEQNFTVAEAKAFLNEYSDDAIVRRFQHVSVVPAPAKAAKKVNLPVPPADTDNQQ